MRYPPVGLYQPTEELVGAPIDITTAPLARTCSCDIVPGRRVLLLSKILSLLVCLFSLCLLLLVLAMLRMRDARGRANGLALTPAWLYFCATEWRNRVINPT